MKSHRQLLCLGVSASIALAELSLPAAPRLSVPPEGVAFGEIAAGEAAAKSIELRNISSSPVAVSHVKGCWRNLGSVPKVPIPECRIILGGRANIMQIACAVAGSVPKFSKDVPLLCCYKKVNK